MIPNMLFIQVLRHLIAVNVTINHKEVLIKTIKNAEKQATTQERLNFLIRCRRSDLTPNFIKNSLRSTEKIFTPSRSFVKRRDNFCRTLLNEAIQATHRNRAFLRRESARLSRERKRNFNSPLTGWVEQQSLMIFHETAVTCHQRLAAKFRALCDKKSEHNENMNRQQQQHHHHQQRVKNLSSANPSQELTSLLDKGPKFALTQTITGKTLRDVEIAVERALNVIRWKTFWSQNTRHAPAARQLSFLPTRSHQAPRADPACE